MLMKKLYINNVALKEAEHIVSAAGIISRRSDPPV